MNVNILIDQLRNLISHKSFFGVDYVFQEIVNLSADDHKSVASKLMSLKNWVPNADYTSYKSPAETSVDGDDIVKFHPYILKPIRYIVNNKSLFCKLGVKEKLDTSGIVQILHRIKHGYLNIQFKEADWNKTEDILMNIYFIRHFI